MQTNEAGVALIKNSEGLGLEAYPDPAHGWSVPTIGYGHTSAAGAPKVTRCMVITAEEADAILRRDLGQYERAVEEALTVPLTANQFSALIGFTFNLGAGNLRSSTLLRRTALSPCTSRMRCR
ncbi:lysozyme [Falsirhodobacter deserti]|uniref:lysozyme n=1 Tax=Falsirhodobacter deserti TaxID=1365611 RepID=UPI0013E2E0BB|nr:lysozyme [Falsirhodobacter deserti]